jgi:LAO/AO transport system kinase
MLDLSDLPSDAWRPPILPAVATTGAGVVEVWDAVVRHREHVTDNGVLAERRAFRTREELREIVAQRLREKAREVCTGERWDELSGSVVAHTVDPWTAADEMLAPVDA